MLSAQNQNTFSALDKMPNNGCQQFAIVFTRLIVARRKGHIQAIDDTIEGRLRCEELFEFSQFDR